MSDFGNRLAEAMALADNLKQTDLARAIGAKKATVGQAVNGQTMELSASFAMRAAQVCDVDPMWLVLGEGVPREPLRNERRALSPKAIYIGRLLDAIDDDRDRDRAYALILQLLEFGGLDARGPR